MDDKLSIYTLIHPQQRADLARAIIAKDWGIKNPPPVLIAMVSGTTYKVPVNG